MPFAEIFCKKIQVHFWVVLRRVNTKQRKKSFRCYANKWHIIVPWSKCLADTITWINQLQKNGVLVEHVWLYFDRKRHFKIFSFLLQMFNLKPSLKCYKQMCILNWLELSNQETHKLKMIDVNIIFWYLATFQTFDLC